MKCFNEIETKIKEILWNHIQFIRGRCGEANEKKFLQVNWKILWMNDSQKQTYYQSSLELWNI